MLDPLPRVVLVPGLGLFGLGRSRPRTRAIAADLAEAAVATITDAEAIGRFQSITRSRHVRHANTGRWSRPSSARRTEQPLAGQVAAITGAGGAIGAATARAFAAAGAEVALLDLDDDGGAETGARRSAARRLRSPAT